MVFQPYLFKKMKRLQLSFLLFSSFFGMVSAQDSHPINALRPEKTLFKNDIEALDFPNALRLLRYLTAQFEVGKERHVGLLFNGKYQNRMRGDGSFSDVSQEEIYRKLPLETIESVEARYDPNFHSQHPNLKYVGTLNFILPASADAPQPEIDPDPLPDPMTERLLSVVKESEPKTGVLATASPRVGFFAGSQLRPKSIFAGAAVEIPLTTRFSLQSEFMLNWKTDGLVPVLLPNGSTEPTSYYLRAIDGSLMFKYYLNPRYQRIFLLAGPYLEFGKSNLTRVDGFHELTPVFDFGTEKRTSFGLNLGLGVQFQAGFFVSLKWSVRSQHDLLYLQNLRGTAVSAGFLFGKP